MPYLRTPIKALITKSVKIKALRQAYHGVECKSAENKDILLFVFIIALLGATIFTIANNRVSFYYLPMLKDLSEIQKYN